MYKFAVLPATQPGIVIFICRPERMTLPTNEKRNSSEMPAGAEGEN